MSASSPPPSFHPYHDPPIVTILIQSSFLLCLNTVNTIFDKLLFCGLLGQVFVGVAWGTAGAGWLSSNVEEVIVQLGYLGLILIVYEGGFSTNIRSVRANLMLSTLVAVTGIAVPISLSFTLQPLLSATPLQAFAAGAALCSTSLGTTFTILSASGLASTRLGTVLSTAAMMDDVVGLVMVQVISNLGGVKEGSGTSFDVVTVVRPLGVSFGFVISVPLVCWGVVKPGTILLKGIRKRTPGAFLEMWLWQGMYTPFAIHTLVLLGLVTGSSFAGTSNLLAAYLAGAAASWWDLEHEGWNCKSKDDSPAAIGDVSERVTAGVTAAVSDSFSSISNHESSTSVQYSPNDNTVPLERATVKEALVTSASAVYEKYYAAAVQRILKPFFFASIGFAIPITKMFSGDIVWRGIIYTILMLFGKLVTGLWLVRLQSPKPRFGFRFGYIKVLTSKFLTSFFGVTRNERSQRNSQQEPQAHQEAREMQNLNRAGPSRNQRINIQSPANPLSDETRISQPEQDVTQELDRALSPSTSSSATSTTVQPHPQISTAAQASPIQKPLSLYPASILGTAMIARGEIGFLIASIAESRGIFAAASSPNQQVSGQQEQEVGSVGAGNGPSGVDSSTGSSRLYLVVIWAIVLCTVVGPVGVGVLVRRVKRLQRGKDGRRGGGWEGDPLGVWGVG